MNLTSRHAAPAHALRRDGDLVHPNTRRVMDGGEDGRSQRQEGRLAHATRSPRPTRFGHFDNHRLHHVRDVQYCWNEVRAQLVGHPYARQMNLFVEPVATGKDSITGKPFVGVAHFEPIQNSTGTLVDDKDMPFHVITYKEVTGGQSRTISNYWTQGGMGVLPTNYVKMNPGDAASLGVRDGDTVKLASRTNPDGILDLGNGQREAIRARSSSPRAFGPA